HARALLSLDPARQIEVAHRVAAKGLSVRETEALVQRQQRGPAAKHKRKTDRDLHRLEEEVSRRLGTTVTIAPGKKGTGNIVVLLWLVLATYHEIVPLAFFGSFIATILLFSMAFFVRDN